MAPADVSTCLLIAGVCACAGGSSKSVHRCSPSLAAEAQVQDRELHGSVHRRRGGGGGVESCRVTSQGAGRRGRHRSAEGAPRGPGRGSWTAIGRWLPAATSTGARPTRPEEPCLLMPCLRVGTDAVLLPRHDLGAGLPREPRSPDMPRPVSLSAPLHARMVRSETSVHKAQDLRCA